MKRHVIAASVLAIAITAAAGAQTAPAHAVVKPNVNPNVAHTVARPGTLASGTGASTSAGFMTAGPYMLTLHALKKDNHAVSGSDFDTHVGVSRNGTSVTIGDGSATTLAGTVSSTHFTATGAQGDGGTLSLSGAPGSSGSANGTFTLHADSDVITGTFTLYPSSSMGPHTTEKIQTYGAPKSGSTGAECGLICKVSKWWAGLHLV